MEPTPTDHTPHTPSPGYYRRVVLATDGSPDAETAAAGIGAMAWPDGTTVVVLGVSVAVAPPPASALPATGVEQDARAYLERLRDDDVARVAASVAATAAALRGRRPGLAVEEIVRAGEPAAEILAQARAGGADLIVAGARGHSPLGALVLGSVSEALVEGASCPVLIVRGAAWEFAAEPFRVLVGIGPEDAAQRLGDALLRLPLPAGARVVAASVAAGTAGGATASGREAAERLAAYLRAGAPGQTVETRPLAGDVAGELLRAATELGAGLIVAGARERRGMLAHLGLGSVSRALVRRAGCSLLIVRGGGAGG